MILSLLRDIDILVEESQRLCYMPNTHAVAKQQSLINQQVTTILLFLQANIKKYQRQVALLFLFPTSYLLSNVHPT